MLDKNGHTDKYIKELFRQSETEKAPKGFADKVMVAIEAELQTETTESWSLKGWWLWGSLIFALIGLIVTVFYVDFSFMGNIFNGFAIDENILNGISQEIGREILGVSEGFQISSVTIAIIAAIGALFVVDRFLRKKPGVEMRTFV